MIFNPKHLVGAYTDLAPGGRSYINFDQRFGLGVKF